MAKCSKCEKEFDVSSVRRSMGRSYGAGVYNDYYPNGDVCEDCAAEEIGSDYNEGEDIIELMGTGWDED